MIGAVLLAVVSVLLTVALVAWLARRMRPAALVDDRPSVKPIRGHLWLLDGHESLITSPRKVKHE